VELGRAILHHCRLEDQSLDSHQHEYRDESAKEQAILKAISTYQTRIL
jgi:hypothetical protein